MKNISMLLFVTMLAISSCTKKSSTTPTPLPTPTPTHPYYFNFTFAGTSYKLNANNPQYMPFYADEAGGYQVADGAFYPSVGIRLSWPSDDTVSESDLMSLKGKTLYFSDTAVHPEISFSKDAPSPAYLSEDAGTSYNLKITNIVFLKKDTSAGNPLKTYVITGTCTAFMNEGTASGVLSGDFNYIICRRDL